MNLLLAYLDAGSGSMLLQLIVGGVAGAGVVARFYGRSMLNVLLRKPVAIAEPQLVEEKPAAEPLATASSK